MNDIDYLKKYYKGNLEEAITKLNSGFPVQYIVGEVDFYGLILKVNEDTLIPRFETEELVAKVLRKLENQKKLCIVDLGTGSGNIAITLKKKLDCEIDAVDISEKALAVAKQNAINNQVEVNFIKGNMLEPLQKKYDVIISNPPYISKDENIMEIVKNNEPSMALYAENNGLYFYEMILKNAKNYLKEKYLIAFEIGCTQGEAISKIANEYFPNSYITVEKDLYDKNRFVFITNKEGIAYE